MYFVKTFKSGGQDYDPRQKTWAVFRCGNCGEETDIDITRQAGTFDFNIERKCPICKAVNPEDHQKNLQAKIDELTVKKNHIEIEIEKLIRELDEATNKVQDERVPQQ